MSDLQLVLDYTGWMSSYVIGKSVVYLPSLPKKIETNTEVSKNKLFQFGEALEWQHHLLEYIFHFLETKDLQSASLVNPFWEKLINRELRKRITPGWITFTYRPLSCQSLHLYTSKEFTYSHTGLGMFVYCPDMIKLEHYVWLDKTANTTMDKMTSFAEYIKKEILPSNVDYCAISCSDIIANNQNVMETVIYHGLLIPFIPNIRTTMFHCDPQRPETVTGFINSDEEVRCLLMFSQQQITLTENFLSCLLKKQNPKTVAIGGGLTNTTKIYKEKFCFKNKHRSRNEIKDLFCITFLQEEGTDANFNAYSLVINHSMYPNHQRRLVFQNELLKLKQTSVLREQGIIFQFRYFINITKQETDLIQHYFPNYWFLSFGLDIDWELGWNTMDKTNEVDKNIDNSRVSKKLKSGVPKSSYSQSTVLVLITWGKKINPSFTA